MQHEIQYVVNISKPVSYWKIYAYGRRLQSSANC